MWMQAVVIPQVVPVSLDFGSGREAGTCLPVHPLTPETATHFSSLSHHSNTPSSFNLETPSSFLYANCLRRARRIILESIARPRSLLPLRLGSRTANQIWRSSRTSHRYLPRWVCC